MAINTPLKIAIGLGTVGGIACTGYAIHQQLTAPTKNLLNKLRADGYQELEHSRSEWTAILTSYIATVKINTNNHLKFDGFDGATNQEEQLKQKCQNALSSTTDTDVNYKKAAKWCTIPRQLKDMLRGGLKLLNADTNESNDEADRNNWNTKINKYNTETNLNKKFTGLPSSGVSKVNEDDGGRKLIKQECKKLETKQHYEIDFENNLEKVELWCAVK